MEENNSQNAYIIQTIDLSSTDSDNDSKECILNETPVLISSNELNSGSHYITCYENGEIVLKQLENSIIKSSKYKKEILKKEEKSSVKLKSNSDNIKDSSQGLRKIQPKPTPKIRKKLCYEKPYIRSLTIKSKHDVPTVLKPRKRLIDHKIMISPQEFKCQLNYTADTIATTKLAPCTRQQLVHVLNGITTLFAHPAHKMPNTNLMQLYISRCTCKKEPNMMSTDDMNLLPLTENITKPTYNNNMDFSPIKNTYKRKSDEITLETRKLQIIDHVNKLPTDLPDSSNINISSIKKIYRNRKCNKESLIDIEKQQIIQSYYINENIDHKYSKKITNAPEPQLVKTNIDEEPQLVKTSIDEEPQCDENRIYTITYLDDIKEEDLTENEIVILNVDNDGELTENNISVLLDAANIKTDISIETTNEVVALTRNIGTDDFKNTISNIYVKRNNEKNESEQILGSISDLPTL